jgi:hypothetical protein
LDFTAKENTQPNRMKKYLPYLLLIIALAVAAVWFIKHPSKGTINEQEGDFAVSDAKEISKITLTDTEKNKVELTNSGGVWMVNGKYAAREDLVKQLLDAVTRVTSLCPVPSAAHDNVIREIMTHHVHAEIFDAKNNLLKSYWVGGPTVDEEKTYMLLEDDGKPVSRPHMTYVPGFKGYLTARYSTDEENWRTRVLFNYTPDEIKSLQVEYPQEENKSFSITAVASDSFAVAPLDEKYRIADAYQQKFVKQYLGFYSSISIEAFDNNYPGKDSLVNTTPYCIITITEKDNSINKVKLFHMPVNKRSKSQFDVEGNEMPYDIDHYYASIHVGKDFAIVQYYVFGKLLRSYKEFFFKPS